MPRNPLIEPFMILLRSTRFLVACIALGIGILVSQVPELSSVMTEIFLLIGVLALAIIHGYSLTDASQYLRNNSDAEQWIDIGLEYDGSETWIKDLVKEVIGEVSSGDNANPPSPI